MAKHILLISVGISPAVITETVYALYKAKDLPDEVVVITTSTGKDEIMKQLFGVDHVWETMLEENDLVDKVRFGEANIRIIPDENSAYSKDIISDKDNNELADFLLKELRGYTEDSATRISFSIAGGRKSMSAVGALSMSLLGRRQDKMYHILVSKPFENTNLEPRFYYPRNIEHKLNDEVYLGNNAQLQLAEIPFVKCRYWLSDKKIDIKNYSAMVAEINKNQLEIKINTKKKEIFVSGSKVESVSNLEFYLYWMLADRCVKNEKSFVHGQNGDILSELFENFLAENDIPRENFTSKQLEDDTLKKKLSSIGKKMEGKRSILAISKGKNEWGISGLISKESIIITEE